jgi:chromosome segregation ATPase
MFKQAQVQAEQLTAQLHESQQHIAQWQVYAEGLQKERDAAQAETAHARGEVEQLQGQLVAANTISQQVDDTGLQTQLVESQQVIQQWAIYSEQLQSVNTQLEAELQGLRSSGVTGQQSHAAELEQLRAYNAQLQAEAATHTGQQQEQQAHAQLQAELQSALCELSTAQLSAAAVVARNATLTTAQGSLTIQIEAFKEQNRNLRLTLKEIKEAEAEPTPPPVAADPGSPGSAATAEEEEEGVDLLEGPLPEDVEGLKGLVAELREELRNAEVANEGWMVNAPP